MASIGSKGGWGVHMSSTTIRLTVEPRHAVASPFQNVRLIDAQDAACTGCDAEQPKQARQRRTVREQIDVRFLATDLTALLAESQEGSGRVRKIIQDPARVLDRDRNADVATDDGTRQQSQHRWTTGSTRAPNCSKR